jgi:hypothetical protein
MGLAWVLAGFALGLLGSVLGLLLVFFSRGNNGKKSKVSSPPASAVHSDFVAPTTEFANAVVNSSRGRVPGGAVCCVAGFLG